jgi:hypothetical protein
MEPRAPAQLRSVQVVLKRRGFWDAPSHYTHIESLAWAAGYNRAVEDDAKPIVIKGARLSCNSLRPAWATTGELLCRIIFAGTYEQAGEYAQRCGLSPARYIWASSRNRIMGLAPDQYDIAAIGTWWANPDVVAAYKYWTTRPYAGQTVRFTGMHPALAAGFGISTPRKAMATDVGFNNCGDVICEWWDLSPLSPGYKGLDLVLRQTGPKTLATVTDEGMKVLRENGYDTEDVLFLFKPE